MTVSSLVAYRANSTASLVHGSKSCGYLSQTDPANIVEVVFDAPRGYRTPWNQLMQQLPKGTKQCSCITDILYMETVQPQITKPNFTNLFFMADKAPISCPHCGKWSQVDSRSLFNPEWFNLKGKWVHKKVDLMMVCDHCQHPMGKTAFVAASSAISFMWREHFSNDKSLSASVLEQAYKWLIRNLADLAGSQDHDNAELIATIVALDRGLWSGRRRELSEIADLMELPVKRVRQLNKIGVRMLRKRLANDPVSPYKLQAKEVKPLQQLVAAFLQGKNFSPTQFILLTQPITVLNLRDDTEWKLNTFARDLAGEPRSTVVMRVGQLLHLMIGSGGFAAGLDLSELVEVNEALTVHGLGLAK